MNLRLLDTLKNYHHHIDDILDPFPIHFLSLHDRYRTCIGFEMTYTGIEEDLDVLKIDELLRKIYDHNKKNPHSNKDIHCPLMHDYLHDLSKIGIYVTSHNGKNMLYFNIKVFQESDLYTLESEEEEEEKDAVQLKFNHFGPLPQYIYDYVYRLSLNIKMVKSLIKDH